MGPWRRVHHATGKETTRWPTLSRTRADDLGALRAAHGAFAGLNREIASEMNIGPRVHDPIEGQPESLGQAGGADWAGVSLDERDDRVTGQRHTSNCWATDFWAATRSARRRPRRGHEPHYPVDIHLCSNGVAPGGTMPQRTIALMTRAATLHADLAALCAESRAMIER